MARSSSGNTANKRRPKINMSGAADKLADLSRNPLARSMLAAGLVAAAAALSSNEKVRQGAKQAGLGALEGADDAAGSAGKIGAAIVAAATEAVRQLMESGGTSKRVAATRKATKPKSARASSKAAAPKTRPQAGKRTRAARQAPATPAPDPEAEKPSE